ncbi:reverse transcriptase domain-containing protein, partial [Tanacetum coccineum]
MGTHMQMIQESQFDGRIRSDPRRHVVDFLEIINLFQYGENQEEAVKLRTFTFSLSEEANTWLNEFYEGTITTWNELREAFISRYSYPAKFKRLLKEIHTFHQLVNETLVDCVAPYEKNASHLLRTRSNQRSDNSNILS